MAKPKSKRLVNEVKWTLGRSIVIFRNWTMPLNPPAGSRAVSIRDGVSARAFALLIIVSLTFAIRAEVNSSVAKISYAAIAATIAGVLSFVLSEASRYLNLKIHERAIISAYASTIGVMFLFVAIQSLFQGFDWYEEWRQIIGSTFLPVILAGLVTYSLLFAKARLLDRNLVSAKAAGAGALIIGCSMIIVLIISFMTNKAFSSLVCLLQTANKC